MRHPILYGSLIGLVVGFLIGISYVKNLIQNPLPSQGLHFSPVDYSSNKMHVRIAQAELCRLGIDTKVDSEFGKQTAINICTLLVRLEGRGKLNR